MGTEFMDLFMLFIGGYLIFCIATGSDKLMNPEALLDENKEQTIHTINIFYSILAAVTLVDGGIGLLRSKAYPNGAGSEAVFGWLPGWATYSLLSNANLVLIGLSLVVIVLLVIYIKKHSKKLPALKK